MYATNRSKCHIQAGLEDPKAPPLFKNERQPNASTSVALAREFLQPKRSIVSKDFEVARALAVCIELVARKYGKIRAFLTDYNWM